MVHQDSVVGDDGSHRLLVVPCALVVLVLVLMVTACSSVGDEASAGGSSGEEQPNATAAAPPVGEGVDEPVVTEDGRMIQPTGHTGLWFETEPPDPLEKLVFESQRFVGHPVALEPIGERALLPQWEDMPDPCHLEVIRRMEELGVEVFEDDDLGYGYAQCVAIYKINAKYDFSSLGWGFVESVSNFSVSESVKNVEYGDFSHVNDGPMFDIFGCISSFGESEMETPAIATYSVSGSGGDCEHSLRTLQFSININGGGFNV